MGKGVSSKSIEIFLQTRIRVRRENSDENDDLQPKRSKDIQEPSENE